MLMSVLAAPMGAQITNPGTVSSGGGGTGSATYYVDNCGVTGNDSNAGTSAAAPWLTVAHVNAHAFNPGDRVLFQGGCIWRETLNNTSSGLPTAPLTFASYGTGQAVITAGNVETGFAASSAVYRAAQTTNPVQVFRDGAPLVQAASLVAMAPGQWFWDGSAFLYVFDNPSGHTIEISARSSAAIVSNVSYVTLQNLHFTKGSGFGVNMSQQLTKYVTLSGDTIDYNYDDGVTTVTDSGNISPGGVITGSTINNNGSSGINLGYAPNWTISNNTINNNGAVCGDDDCGGIYAYNTYTTGLVITGNTLTGNGGSNGISGNGIWVDTIGAGCVISGNASYSNTLSGISVENTSGASVSLNHTYKNGNNGIQLNGGTTGWVLANNSITGNVAYGNGAYGLAALGNTTANTMTENQVLNNQSFGNTTGALRAIDGGNNDGTFGSGNVYLYNSLGPQATNFIVWGAANESTYQAWETATGNCGSAGCSKSIEPPVTTYTTTIYRCSTAGTLPVGALTTATGNCGASVDTGMRSN